MTHQLHFQAAAYPGGMRQAPHTHDELHLSIVLAGVIRETVSGRSEHAGVLSIVAKDPGVVHADDFGDGPVVVARLSLAGAGTEALVEGAARAFAWRWSHDPAIAAPFLRIVERGSAGTSRFAADDADVVDLLARLTARRTPEAAGRPPRWLADVVERVRHEWRPQTRVADLARDAGVHPVYLARCVRRWYGTGVAELLRAGRLRAAAAELARSAERLSLVAYGSGYCDESHFSREFSRLAGTTPGRYRSLLERLERLPVAI